jgi:hypothetical protein
LSILAFGASRKTQWSSQREKSQMKPLRSCRDRRNCWLERQSFRELVRKMKPMSSPERRNANNPNKRRTHCRGLRRLAHAERLSPSVTVPLTKGERTRVAKPLKTKGKTTRVTKALKTKALKTKALKTKALKTKVAKGLKTKVAKGLKTKVTKALKTKVAKGLKTKVTKGLKTKVTKALETKVAKG